MISPETRGHTSEFAGADSGQGAVESTAGRRRRRLIAGHWEGDLIVGSASGSAIAPVFPERFGTIGEPRSFMTAFVEGYNHTHRHSGIGLNTPVDVHDSLAAERTNERAVTLAAARVRNPERFSSYQTPKILALPWRGGTGYLISEG